MSGEKDHPLSRGVNSHQCRVKGFLLTGGKHHLEESRPSQKIFRHRFSPAYAMCPFGLKKYPQLSSSDQWELEMNHWGGLGHAREPTTATFLRWSEANENRKEKTSSSAVALTMVINSSTQFSRWECFQYLDFLMTAKEWTLRNVNSSCIRKNNQHLKFQISL